MKHCTGGLPRGLALWLCIDMSSFLLRCSGGSFVVVGGLFYKIVQKTPRRNDSLAVELGPAAFWAFFTGIISLLQMILLFRKRKVPMPP